MKKVESLLSKEKNLRLKSIRNKRADQMLEFYVLLNKLEKKWNEEEKFNEEN